MKRYRHRRKQTPEHREHIRAGVKRYWAARHALYNKVALENTSNTVTSIRILEKRDQRDYLGIAFASRGYMEVPRPRTPRDLLVFLHECWHMPNFDPWQQPHYSEYLADTFAIETMEAAGIRCPFWDWLECQAHVKEYILKDEAKGLFIDPQAAKFAMYQPKPYAEPQFTGPTFWFEETETEVTKRCN